MVNRSSIGCVRQLHQFQSRYLHPNHYCCQLLQSDVWTLLTSLTSKSESATASRSTMSSARKPKNRLSLSESLKRSILKTGNVCLRLDFQKLSHFHFVHKDMAWGKLRKSRTVWKYRSLPIATGRFGTFCPRPHANVFGCCALQRVMWHFCR